MLKFDHVSKRYNGLLALNDVSISFEEGKLYALVGPNGSGKTTLMKSAAGLVKPEQGTIFYNGAPIVPATKEFVAYMPTEPYFYTFMTIGQVAKYHKDFYPDFDYPYFLQLLNYMELNEKLKVKALSSGMAAKLKIAITLARRAKILMLDEPLNGIDIIARDQIISSILASASRECSFIISSHLFDELEPIVNDIVMVKNGQIIINGNINDVRKQNNKSISDLYREIYSPPAYVPYGFSPVAPFNPNMPPQQFNPNMPPQQFNPNMPPQQFNPNMPPQQFNPNTPPQQFNPNTPPQQFNPNTPQQTDKEDNNNA